MSLPLLSLVVANLLPLAGVLFFDWSLRSIILLYWLENGIIGIYHIGKMIVTARHGLVQLANSESGTAPGCASIVFIPFFLVHYGGFWAIHGFFVLSLFSEGDAGSVVWGVVSLAISHGISFVQNFLGQQEYQHYTSQRLMFQPYARVVVLHLTILLGGFLSMALQSPIWTLVSMVLLKIVVDAISHLAEHRKFTLITN